MNTRKVLICEDKTFYPRVEIHSMLTPEYICGLFEGEGTFSTHGYTTRGERLPCVALKMHYRDKELIEAIRDYFGLKNKVYEYTHQNRHFVMLVVRDTSTLKNKMVPFFRNRLLGHKGVQFEAWLRMFPYLNSLPWRNPITRLPHANESK